MEDKATYDDLNTNTEAKRMVDGRILDFKLYIGFVEMKRFRTDQFSGIT